MAEFQEVIKQKLRMCRIFQMCSDCPIYKAGVRCSRTTINNSEKIERVIMDWAAEHPEPRYPTWEEWQSTNFTKSDCAARPCMFMHCKNHDECKKKTCMNHPIPADIAQKLGIQPITEERVDK